MLQSIDKKNIIITYLIMLFILSTTSFKFITSQNNYPSIINKININGLSNEQNSEILHDLSDLFYKNIFFIDKKKINEVIIKHNTIEKYSIKKIYPSTINIDIKATKYLARVSNDNQIFVGANGKFIKDKKNNKTLPYIFGEFKPEDFLVFKGNIEKSKFHFTEFKTIYFFPSNRWDILTNNDTLIKLPQDSFLESINLAYKIITSNDFKNKTLIDLRIKNHLIVK